MKFIKLRLLPLLFLLIGSSLAHADNNALTFSKVWIAEAPPMSSVLAAYMKIENNSDEDIQITPPSSSTFSSTAFHKTIFEDGMAKMRHREHLIIPANGSLELKRGSFHMMLFNPVTPLREGDNVIFIFELQDKKTLSVNASVKKAH